MDGGHLRLATGASSRRVALSAQPLEHTMSASIPRALIIIVVAAAWPLLAHAQTIPKAKGPERTFRLFHFFCLQHLPDIEGIERAAGFGEYDQLYGEDLAPYTPDKPFDKLLGWRYHDHGDEFVLTVIRAKPDDVFKTQMPAYATGTETTCSLRIPNAKPELLLGELTRTLRRAPDKTWQDGATHVYSWTHQDAKGVSYVQYYVPENAGTKAMLSASLYAKK